MDPEKIYREFLKHIERIGLKDFVDVNLRDMYTWSQTPADSRTARTARKAFESIGLKPYIVYRLPGSAPMYLFTKKLGIHVVSAGPGHGGRAHAPNEYITVDTIPKMAKYTPTYFELFKAGIE